MPFSLPIRIRIAKAVPGAAMLLDLARRAAELGTLEGDEQWEHVTHCSPCYKEYLEARDQLR